MRYFYESLVKSPSGSAPRPPCLWRLRALTSKPLALCQKGPKNLFASPSTFFFLRTPLTINIRTKNVENKSNFNFLPINLKYYVLASIYSVTSVTNQIYSNFKFN